MSSTPDRCPDGSALLETGGAAAPSRAPLEKFAMALIEIERLVKRFGGFTAVDGVSFTVERGTVLG